MKKILVSYNDDLLFKIKKLADLLEVPEFKVINTSLVFGFYKYWFPYQKILSNLPDMKIYSIETTKRLQKFKGSLKEQIESDYDAIKELDRIEGEFEKEHSYETFATTEEYCMQLSNYRTTQSKSEVEQPEKVIERQEPHPVVQKVSQKTHQKKKKQKRKNPRNLYFLHRHGLYILLTTVLNFLIFIAFWTSIPEFQVLLEYQLVIIMIAIGLFISLFFGLFYYRAFPTLEVWKLTRIIREFNKMYSKRIYKNKTERLQVLTGYVQSKYNKDSNGETQNNYSKISKDIDLIRKFGKFTKDNIILSCILICISIILAIIWIPLFLMYYLDRWAWLANNLWVYPVTWILIALVIIDLLLLMQKNHYYV